MKSLIVAPAWIGDTVMAHALFKRLHQLTPGLQLTPLAPRWVAPVLQRMPEIGQIIDNPFAHGELSLPHATAWRGNWPKLTTRAPMYYPIRSSPR